MQNLSRRFSTLQVPKLSTPPPQPIRPLFQYSKIQHCRKILEHRIITVLDVCTTLTQAQQVHAHVIANGLSQYSYVITKLIRTLTKLGVPMGTYPELVFRRVTRPNPFLWAAMIRGCVIEGQVSEAVRFYGLMRREGTGPVSFTFSSLFKGCGSVGDVSLGRQVHAQTVVIGGFAADLYVGNTMIDMYLKCGELGCGRKVFDEMPERDVVSWTELIAVYAKSGDMGSARELFEELSLKDMVAWTAMVTGYAQNLMPREALDCFERMRGAGVGIDEVTLLGVVSACAQLGACRYANWVRGIAGESGFGPAENVLVGSALIDMYAKCGSLDDAYDIFRGMKQRNVFSYSSMIWGFAVHGNANAAIELFHEMLTTDVIRPNRVTFIGVLTACSHAGMVDQGRQLFATMEKYYNVTPSAEHYTCMVDLLGRAGRLEEALELAETMPIVAHGGVWGALLGACRIHKNPGIAQIAASHLFELEPKNIGNYVMLSNIYASAGRWGDVSSVRKLMREKGLKKNPAYSWVETKNGGVEKFSAGDTRHPDYEDIKKALEDLLNRLQDHGYRPNLNSVDYDVGDEEKMRILMAHSEKLALAYALLNADTGPTIKIIKNIRICEDCHGFMCGASQVTGRHIIVRDNMRFHHFENGKCNCGNFW
ncbi:PREDICTED: pentatricopeptide repeat-containing protein At5g44230 [Fragaria vesca subsp. vesca]|uniref:pentatricopeptide repeat-containing protein At5g44230 n=1 Tax=Fragaria vesca subsp. vesca TaxID=101020 RepID=UPI0002C31214|nr:PREDICTED: pentatricopeptide repeat-containing protein At5g44230 [Fragaria vesca subsp. vesca]